MRIWRKDGGKVIRIWREDGGKVIKIWQESGGKVTFSFNVNQDIVLFVNEQSSASGVACPSGGMPAC